MTDKTELRCLVRWREHGLVHECWNVEDHDGRHVCKDFDCGSSHWVGTAHEIHDEPVGPRGFVCGNCGTPVMVNSMTQQRVVDLIRDHEKECFA